MDLPNLNNEKVLGFDTETYDPHLKELGPSTRRGGFIAGFSLATMGGDAWYFPIAHKEGENCDPDQTMRWLKDTLQGKKLVGTNLKYDLEYMAVQHDYQHNGEIYDVQIAEPLIDENLYNYSLDALARKYLQEHKDDEELHQWLASKYGGKADRKTQADRIWMAPGEVVRPYGMSDAELPLRIMKKQWKEIKEQNLEQILDLEHDLMPVLLKMRVNGVRVDMDKLDEVSEVLRDKRKEALKKAGADIWSAASIARAYDKRKLEYPLTEKGNPSFTKAVLNKTEFGRTIAEARRYDTAVGTFIDGHFGRYVIGDRLYAQFHQLRGDDGGTISGRLSSSHPNLQNIPARDPEIGPLIRSVFVAEPGHKYVAYDYSQIEPRLVIHYAPGTEHIRRMYKWDPATDCYRAFMANLPEWIDRWSTKILYLAMTYGQGKKATAESLGVPLEDAERILDAFHNGAPYINQLKRMATGRAKERGYITTLLGRRRRFNLWESTDWKTARKDGAMEEEIARNKYTRVKRAFVYKALNGLIQGSAADVMKQAMVYLDREFPEHVPLLTVHDELGYSAGEDFPYQRIKDIMEHCVDLRVPLLTDMSVGNHWGECK